MNTVAVVAMTPEHVAALMRYEKSMFGTEAWSRNAYLTEIADTAHRYYVAAENGAGELLGWGGVLILGTSAEILTVGVVPAHRRGGIARAMLAELLGEARGRGVTEVFLEVREDNRAARRLYETDGFVQVGMRPGYYDHGRVSAVVMRREL